MKDAIKKTSIQTAGLITFLYGFAMIPLPLFDGNPTGLKLTYNLMAFKHIKETAAWVVGLDNISYKKDDNGESINAVQFDAYIHGGDKPKIYEYPTDVEFQEAMKDWRVEKKRLHQILDNLKKDRRSLSDQREVMIALSPVETFLQVQ